MPINPNYQLPTPPPAAGGALGQVDPNLLLNIMGQAIQAQPPAQDGGNGINPNYQLPKALGTVGDERQTAPTATAPAAPTQAAPAEASPESKAQVKAERQEQIKDFKDDLLRTDYAAKHGLMTDQEASLHNDYAQKSMAQLQAADAAEDMAKPRGVLGSLGYYLGGGHARDISTERGALGNVEKFGTLATQEAALGVGKTDDEKAFNDLMTGNNGQPRVDPKGVPYTPLTAIAAVTGAKSAEGKSVKAYTVPGQTAPIYIPENAQPPAGAVPYEAPAKAKEPVFLTGPNGETVQAIKNTDTGKYEKPDGTPLIGNYTPYTPPKENRFEDLPIGGVTHKVELDAKDNIVKDWGPVPKTAEQTAADERKDDEPIYAYDKAHQRLLTTRGEAKANGYTNPTAASAAEQDKEQLLTAQLNDVQLNVSRYQQSVNKIKSNIAPDHLAAMGGVLSDAPLNSYLTSLAPGAQVAADIVRQSTRAGDWNKLSPEEQDLVIGYLRAKGSIVAWNKVLSGSARAAEKQLQIEMQNLPAPQMGSTVSNKQLDAFQQNINVVSKAATKFPGMDTPQEIKKQVEDEGKSQNAAPEGHQVNLQGGGTATKKGGKWINDKTGQEVTK